ncbi:MAG: zinc-binding dehydrogenase, partial [Pacificimonas sp.]
DDVAPAVMELTNNRGVDVAIDGVGKATWDSSLASLKMRGLQISYGNASGPVGARDIAELAPKSLFTTRPKLFDYYASPEEIKTGTGRVFHMLRSGKLDITIGQSFALEDAEKAHRALESRETIGATVILP